MLIVSTYIYLNYFRIWVPSIYFFIIKTIFNTNTIKGIMSLEAIEEKKEQRKKKLFAASKALGIGLVEGALCSGIAIIPVLVPVIEDYFIFVGLIIWLVFGWFSTYLIQLNTMEILVTIISSGLISLVIFYVVHIHWVYISIMVGLSMLFWIISFVTKIFIFPPKYLQKSVEAQEKNSIE